MTQATSHACTMCQQLRMHEGLHFSAFHYTCITNTQKIKVTTAGLSNIKTGTFIYMYTSILYIHVLYMCIMRDEKEEAHVHAHAYLCLFLLLGAQSLVVVGLVVRADF